MRAEQESGAEGTKWGNYHQASAGGVRGAGVGGGSGWGVGEGGSVLIFESQTSPVLCSDGSDRYSVGQES